MLLRGSLVAQTVKNLPAMGEAWVWSLGSEDPLWGGHGNPLQYSCLENSHGQRILAGYSPWGWKGLDTTEQLSTAQHKVLFSLLSAGFRAKEQVCGTGQIKINASWCSSFDQPKASLHTTLLSVCFQTLLFFFWYMGLFWGLPLEWPLQIRGVSRLFSLLCSWRISCNNGDPWSSGICPWICFSLMPMLLQFAGLGFCFGLPWPWNTFMPACQHPVDNSPDESSCPSGFWPTCSANPFSLPFFVNILSASWALPEPKPHLVPRHCRRNVIIRPHCLFQSIPKSDWLYFFKVKDGEALYSHQR